MSPAGRTFDNTGLLSYLAEVDAELPAGEHVKIAVISEGMPLGLNDHLQAPGQSSTPATEPTRATEMALS